VEKRKRKKVGRKKIEHEDILNDIRRRQDSASY
jgi:hypothetical protein